MCITKPHNNIIYYCIMFNKHKVVFMIDYMYSMVADQKIITNNCKSLEYTSNFYVYDITTVMSQCILSYSCDCCVQYQWYASLYHWRWIVVVLMSAQLVRPEWVSWRPPVSAQDTPCSEPATHEPTQPANLRACIPIIIICRWLITTALISSSSEHSTQPFTNPCES